MSNKNLILNQTMEVSCGQLLSTSISYIVDSLNADLTSGQTSRLCWISLFLFPMWPHWIKLPFLLFCLLTHWGQVTRPDLDHKWWPLSLITLLTKVPQPTKKSGFTLILTTKYGPYLWVHGPKCSCWKPCKCGFGHRRLWTQNAHRHSPEKNG